MHKNVKVKALNSNRKKKKKKKKAKFRKGTKLVRKQKKCEKEGTMKNRKSNELHTRLSCD